MCGRQHWTALAGATPTLEATEQFQPGRFGDALVTQVDGDEAPEYGNGLCVERCPGYTAVQTRGLRQLRRQWGNAKTTRSPGATHQGIDDQPLGRIVRDERHFMDRPRLTDAIHATTSLVQS